jgi:positive regulator of sigma E activity
MGTLNLDSLSMFRSVGPLIFIIALGAAISYVVVDAYNRLVAQRNRYC